MHSGERWYSNIPGTQRRQVVLCFKLKSHEISFVHNFRFNCPEHGTITAVICAIIQNDWITETDVIGKRDFARFEFKMSFWRISYIAHHPGAYDKRFSKYIAYHRNGWYILTIAKIYWAILVTIYQGILLIYVIGHMVVIWNIIFHRKLFWTRLDNKVNLIFFLKYDYSYMVTHAIDWWIKLMNHLILTTMINRSPYARETFQYHTTCHIKRFCQVPNARDRCLWLSNRSEIWQACRMIAAISQTTFSDAFSGIKLLEFRLSFHFSLFLRIQLTIFQHWFR